VRYAYAGWRALPAVRGPAGRLNREAFVHQEACAAGAVHSVVGGKLTTHRSFAERVIGRLLGRSDPSPSRTQPLPGGAGPQEFADPLWWRHGSRTAQVRALAGPRPELLEPICPHRELLRAEAVFAMQQQAVVTFADLMLRRLFHSHGPCLEPACLASMHELYAEYRTGGSATLDSAVDIAGLTAAVRYALGALR
jgi:glycerol-3-phosphate dehydrogenase